MAELTHIDGAGNARMVEVGEKPVTRREAVAEGFVRMSPMALAAVVERTARKGDVLGVAQLGGVGFTMSLFVTGLAFSDQEHIAEAKLGILVGSTVAAVVGLWILSRTLPAAPPKGARAAMHNAGH